MKPIRIDATLPDADWPKRTIDHIDSLKRKGSPADTPPASPQHIDAPTAGNAQPSADTSDTEPKRLNYREKLAYLLGDFDEAAHPRDADGKFTAGGGSESVASAIKSGKAHTVSEDDFVKYHVTGSIPSDAYQRYEDGDLDFIKKADFGEAIDRVKVNGHDVEIRVQAEPAQYTKWTPEASQEERDRLYQEYEDAARALGTTPMMAGIDLGRDSEKYKQLAVYEKRWLDSGSKIVRDAHGNAEVYSPQEMQERGLPPFSYTVGAFVGDKAVGYSGDEFGATGVYVARQYQQHGIGLKLLKTFLEKSGRLQKGAKLGQMTPAGKALVRRLHRELVKDAKSHEPAHLSEWDEALHPRAEDGKFTDGGGSGGTGGIKIADGGDASRKAAVAAVAYKVATSLAFDESRIDVVDQDPRQFSVAGRELSEGGHYDPRTGRIQVNAITADRTSPEMMGGLVSHEIMHAAQDTLERVVAQERNELRAMSVTGKAEWDRLFKPMSGYPKDDAISELTRRFPASALQAMYAPDGDAYLGTWKKTNGRWAFDDDEHYNRLGRMIAEDGATAYSSLYWQEEANKAEAYRQYRRAIGETLAETSRFHTQEGTWSEGTPSKRWQEYATAIRKIYPAIKDRDKR